MRTLFCSHLNGVQVPPSLSDGMSGPDQPGGGLIAPLRRALVSLGSKCLGGELPAGQRGAEPPALRSATRPNICQGVHA